MSQQTQYELLLGALAKRLKQTLLQEEALIDAIVQKIKVLYRKEALVHIFAMNGLAVLGLSFYAQ